MSTISVHSSTTTSTPSTTTSILYIGADVAKDSIELFADKALLPKLPASIANTAAGFKRLLGTLKTPQARGLVMRVICEATGAYQRAFVKALQSGGLEVCVVNPRQARRFAEANAAYAKTDKIDARMLALMGQKIPLRVNQAQSASQESLSALSTRRAQLVSMRSSELRRLPLVEDAYVRADLRASIAALGKRIAKLDKAIAKVIGGDGVLQEKSQQLCTVAGVGEVSAAALLAACPELGALGKGQIASLAGLAPYNRDSGKMQGQRSIGGGRRSMRAALYMAAVSAARYNTHLRGFYGRLRAAGKPFKVAITAVMRKLLIHINALLRQCSPLTPAAASGAGSLRGGMSPSSNR